MKIGRRPAKNAEEFRALVLNRREFFGYSLAALANISRVNRGTLSEFFNGKRLSFGYDDRLKLIKALDMGADAEERFLDEKHRRAMNSPLVLFDPSLSSHRALEQGQSFLASAAYPEAKREFKQVYLIAADRNDLLLQADVAAHLAWAYYEEGLYGRSMEYICDGIRLITNLTGTSFGQIMSSISPVSRARLCPLSQKASHVLNRLLHIRAKDFIESVIYYGREHLRQKATEAIEQSVALDRYLQLPVALGHDLRWQAVLVASSMTPELSTAEKLLSEGEEQFKKGSIGAAYLLRDRGNINWRAEHYCSSKSFLMEAVDALSSYAESHALAPTLYILSHVAMHSGADEGIIRRYALAGAVLKPYGFVLENAKFHAGNATRRGLSVDIDHLRSGHKPFDMLAPVLSRLGGGLSDTVDETIRQNLSRALPPGFELSR